MKHNRLIPADEVNSKLNENPDFIKAKRKNRPYNDLVVEIITRRVELRLSQKELAEKAGTHQSRISKIESAELDVRLSTLIEIAEALETELEIRLLPIIEPGDFKRVFNATFEFQAISERNIDTNWKAQP
jgi:transcriptional regulator with XRE-family HTH domain